MEIFLLALGAIFVFAISAYGWGEGATKWLYKNPTRSIAYNISIGLAVWVFLGGILNALGLAYSMALDSILILGILFFALLLFYRRKERGGFSLPDEKKEIRRIVAETFPLLLIFSATSFLIFTLLPAGAFNHHDDFFKYLPRLYRMLQSGKVGGTPFDFIGIDSFGGYAFLQAFAAAAFPFRYINGFDAVFCFLLGGLLLNDIGRRLEIPWFLRSAAIAAFVVINPQYVNVSALYCGSSMILALIYASLILGELPARAEQSEMFKAAIVFALIASALITFKQTFVPFTIAYSVLFFVLLFLLSRQRKAVAATAGVTGAMAGVALAPWLWSVRNKIAVFYHLFLTVDHRLPHAQAQGTGSHSAVSAIFSPTKFYDDLFSAHKLFYGGHVGDYSFLVLCTLAAALWAGYRLVKREGETDKRDLVIAAAGISTMLAYLVNGHFGDTFDVGIRYSCPLLIAAFPAIALLLGRRSSPGGRKGASGTGMCTRQFVVWVSVGVGVGLFLSGWYGRASQLVQYRSMLSYPFKSTYITYENKVFSHAEQQKVIAMQNQTEKNTTILVWFQDSFYLNFGRNRIFNVADPGMVARIGGYPIKKLKNADWLRKYLEGLGVRYVIWGYYEPVKAPYSGRFELEEGINALAKQGRIVYNDGDRVMIDLKD